MNESGILGLADQKGSATVIEPVRAYAEVSGSKVPIGPGLFACVKGGKLSKWDPAAITLGVTGPKEGPKDIGRVLTRSGAAVLVQATGTPAVDGPVKINADGKVDPAGATTIAHARVIQNGISAVGDNGVTVTGCVYIDITQGVMVNP